MEDEKTQLTTVTNFHKRESLNVCNFNYCPTRNNTEPNIGTKQNIKYIRIDFGESSLKKLSFIVTSLH